MRHVRLRPGQTQFSLRCSCGANASGVLDTSAYEELLKILLNGHEGHPHHLDRRDGETVKKLEAA